MGSHVARTYMGLPQSGTLWITKHETKAKVGKDTKLCKKSEKLGESWQKIRIGG